MRPDPARPRRRWSAVARGRGRGRSAVNVHTGRGASRTRARRCGSQYQRQTAARFSWALHANQVAHVRRSFSTPGIFGWVTTVWSRRVFQPAHLPRRCPPRPTPARAGRLPRQECVSMADGAECQHAAKGRHPADNRHGPLAVAIRCFLLDGQPAEDTKSEISDSNFRIPFEGVPSAVSRQQSVIFRAWCWQWG